MVGVQDLSAVTFGTLLGYVHNGEEAALRRGRPDRVVNLRLDGAVWEATRRHDITIDGLDGCLDLFGLPPS